MLRKEDEYKYGMEAWNKQGHQRPSEPKNGLPAIS
jgi:hypothetical protein